MPVGLTVSAGRRSRASLSRWLANSRSWSSAPAQAAGGTLRGDLDPAPGRLPGLDYFQVDVYKAAGDDTWQLETSREVVSWSSGLGVGEFAIALPAGSYRACFTKRSSSGFGDDTGRRCWRRAATTSSQLPPTS